MQEKFKRVFSGSYKLMFQHTGAEMSYRRYRVDRDH